MQNKRRSFDGVRKVAVNSKCRGGLYANLGLTSYAGTKLGEWHSRRRTGGYRAEGPRCAAQYSSAESESVRQRRWRAKRMSSQTGVRISKSARRRPGGAEKRTGILNGRARGGFDVGRFKIRKLSLNASIYIRLAVLVLLGEDDYAR